MFQYYFLLGLRSLRRNPALTALMVLTLALVNELYVKDLLEGRPAPGEPSGGHRPCRDLATDVPSSRAAP